VSTETCWVKVIRESHRVSVYFVFSQFTEEITSMKASCFGGALAAARVQ